MTEESLHARSNIVVDGDISVDKLLQLIEHNAEENFLDYRRLYDLPQQRHKMDLVCDLVSMANPTPCCES